MLITGHSGRNAPPVRRRQVYTQTGPAMSGAHGISARRTRRALVRPRGRPGDLKRTQTVSVRPRRRGQPPSAHTDHPYVGPCQHSTAGPPLARPQTAAAAPADEGRHLPADEDRPRRRRLPLLTTRLTRTAASTPPRQGGTQSRRISCPCTAGSASLRGRLRRFRQVSCFSCDAGLLLSSPADEECRIGGEGHPSSSERPCRLENGCLRAVFTRI
jgi:hypothetical protein